ncbi:MAG TPA: DNA repair exonuclease [bacterium]|nr:DNA repair exonuclease [bacterium]
MPKKLSLIHTADLHLGKSFQELGTRGVQLRRRIISAFRRTVDLALDRRADLFLIAGDLFDSNTPSREAQSVLEAEFARLAGAGIRVAVMPGTHDPPGSRPFASPVFSSRPRHVFVLTPEAPSLVLDDLDLAIGAYFPCRDRAGEWTGPDESLGRGRTFCVAMAHGSAMSGLSEGGPEDRIPDSILRAAGVHYLALGHHHGARVVADAAMPAYYSGSPEMLAIDQKEAGHALHVILEERGGRVEVTVDKARVGTLRYQRLKVGMDEARAGRDLAQELTRLADPELFLDLILEGAAALDAELPDLAGLESTYADAFFKLRLIDRTTRTRELNSLAEVPPASVLAEFMRRMQERIKEAKSPEREEWEEALRLGIHFLSGGGVP